MGRAATTYFGTARKPALKVSAFQRPSAEIPGLLGVGDLAILVLYPERAERFLPRGLVPPALRVERGRQAKTLASSLALVAPDSRWPLIISIECGASAVTRCAGIDFVDGVLR